MIGILPKLHEDELLYSFLARYGVMSSYSTYRGIAEDVYVNPLCCPNILLLNCLTEDLLEKLKPQATLKDIITEHTMFPWFVRFARRERRDKAYKLALDMNIKKLYDSLPVPNYSDRYNKRRVLKYCPICSREDREKYGETYFRTFHQIFELDICPIHHCRLHNTCIVIDGRVSPAFISAEEVVPRENEIICSESDLEIRLSEYLLEVFQSPFDIDNREEIKDYLSSHLHQTSYIRKTTARMMEQLTKDFNSFYKAIGIKRELWELQKVFTGYCYNLYEIALVGLFLNILPNDLCKYNLPLLSC